MEFPVFMANCILIIVLYICHKTNSCKFCWFQILEIIFCLISIRTAHYYRIAIVWLRFYSYAWSEILRLISSYYSDKKVPFLIDKINKFDMEYNLQITKRNKPTYLIGFIMITITSNVMAIIFLNKIGFTLINFGRMALK